MRFLSFFVSVILSFLFQFSSFAWAIEFDLHATLPECEYENHRSTFCTKKDSELNAERSGLELRVANLIRTAQDPEKSLISIAYFSFSNPVVFDALCERGKMGIKIQGFFDTSYSQEKQLPNRLLNECQGPTQKNVSIYFLGTPKGKSSWRIHHNKFLYVDTGSDDLSINYSSGNLSSYGLSNHLDHWVLMTAGRTTKLAQTYDCVIRSMLAASSDIPEKGDDPKKYQTELKSCFTQSAFLVPKTLDQALENIESDLLAEEISSLFAPSREDFVYQILKNQIDRVSAGGEILGGIQHFLHRGIAADLRNAAARGVKVVLLMDDDVVLGTSGVPQARQFFYRELYNQGIELRLMDTNNMDVGGFEPPQMMHHKFLILKGIETAQGKQTRVFSGAGQFTNAAMKSNYENFGLLVNKEITEKYQNLFHWLYEKSMDLNDPILSTKRRPKPKP